MRNQGKFGILLLYITLLGPLSGAAGRAHFMGAAHEAALSRESGAYRSALQQEKIPHDPFPAEDKRDFRISLLPAIFLDRSGNTVLRMWLRLHPDRFYIPRTDSGGYLAVFEVTAAVDAAGEIVERRARTYRLEMNALEYLSFLKDGAILGLTIPLAPGKYRVRAVVRESSTARTSSLSVPVEVDRFPEARPSISSVVLSQKAVVASPTGTEPANPDYNPLGLGKVELLPFFAESLRPSGSLIVCFYVYNVDAGGQRFVYRMNLYCDEVLLKSTEPRPAASMDRHPSHGYLLKPTISLSGLPKGLYRVEVELARPEGTDRMVRSANFRIR